MKSPKNQQTNQMINRGHILIIFAMGIFGGLAQNTTLQDSLETQKVSVVKPYSPTLSEAFKLKTWPAQPNFQADKKSIKYNIFSAPVASIFTPAKSKSVGLPKAKNLKTFDNVARLSVGNYTSISGDLFLNYTLSKREQVLAKISHNSSQGGIDEVYLDDAFSNNSAIFSYQSLGQDSNLDFELGYRRHMTNWYGIANELTTEMLSFSNVKQSLSVFETSGAYALSESWFEEVRFQANFLSDRFDSQEINLSTALDLKFNVLNTSINTKVELNILKGSFANGYWINQPLDYNNTIGAVFPSYTLNQGDLNLKAGFGAYFFSGSRTSKQQFYFVPNIEATYTVVDGIVLSYAGIQGDLKQNTYLGFYDQNPFVSPNLDLKPTYMPFKIFLGSKGKLTNQLSFDIKGQYSKLEDFTFFKKHAQPELFNGPGYRYGNSFEVVYDDIKVMTCSASLEGYVSDKFQFSSQMKYNAFSVESESQAWNLPNLEAEVNINWTFAPQWRVNFHTFYIGERFDDQSFDPSTLYENLDREVSLEPIVDLNLALHYTLNERWVTQLKFNNILGKNYQRWYQYPTQGLQVIAGVYYKFDF